jgi:hypothetical protein
VLLGVASPTDLMKHANQTPFNIGHPIDLQELTRRDAVPLQEQLDTRLPGRGAAILDRVFSWTGGHPYLTQKLCAAIAESPANAWTDEQIDQQVALLFFGDKRHTEENFKFVQRFLEHRPERRHLLTLYRRIHAGETISEDETSFEQNRLKLAGLVRSQEQTLQVRNGIYQQVFDQQWVTEQMPRDRARIITLASIGVSVVALLAYFFLVMPWQEARRLAITAEDTRTKIQDPRTQHADLQLDYFFKLCEIEREGSRNRFFAQQDDGASASTLFMELPHDKQCALFTEANATSAGDKVMGVVACLGGVAAADDPAVQHAMCEALCKIDTRPASHMRQTQQCECKDSYSYD